MPALIRGRVFNDLNRNGVYNPGEPGIPNVLLVAVAPNNTCLSTTTNASGIYTFSNITLAGTYRIYEVVANPFLLCPPTTLYQPPGFTSSTTVRSQTLTITQSQINNNTTLTGTNYGHDNPNFFPCEAGLAYQVAIPGGSTTSTLYELNLVTGVRTVLSPLTIGVNAIGYNTLDNLIYGIQNGTNTLVRIDESGVVTPILNFGALTPTGFSSGTFDLNGYLYLYLSNNALYYTVDLNPSSIYYGSLINPNTGLPMGSPYGLPPSTPLNILDWSFDPTNNCIWSIRVNVNNIYCMNPLNGVVQTFNYLAPAIVERYRATFIDASGYLYGIPAPGNVYRFDLTTNPIQTQLFAPAPASDNSDGANCIISNIELDFGDAPDTGPGNGPDNYSSLLANNGPRHLLGEPLYLGTTVTPEDDARVNADATGDDIPAGIQDDGVATPLAPLLTTDTTYTLPITYTNDTGSPAFLYGWIDFNKDGIFQLNESITPVVVPSIAPAPQTVNVTFTVPISVTLTPDHTFVRLRLTSDVLVNQNTLPTSLDTRSLGPAGDGEVEDYYLEIIELLFDIYGKVWLDNCDGIYVNPPDTPLSQMTVELYNATTNTLIATTLTNASGDFVFENVSNGNYYIRYVKPPSLLPYQFVLKNIGTSQVMSNTSTYGQSDVFTVASADVILRDAPIVTPVTTLTGIVFEDTNCNGALDPGDVRLANIPVVITQDGVATTVFTNSEGVYTWSTSSASTVSIVFPPRPGFKFSPIGTTSTVDGSGQVIILSVPLDYTTCTPLVLNYGAGYCSLDYCVCGKVFLECLTPLCRCKTSPDTFKQLIPLPNTPLSLYNAQSVLIETQLTASDGSFSFCKLTPSIYFLRLTLSDGCTLSNTSYTTDAVILNVAQNTLSLNLTAYNLCPIHLTVRCCLTT